MLSLGVNSIFVFHFKPIALYYICSVYLALSSHFSMFLFFVYVVCGLSSFRFLSFLIAYFTAIITVYAIIIFVIYYYRIINIYFFAIFYSTLSFVRFLTSSGLSVCPFVRLSVCLSICIAIKRCLNLSMQQYRFSFHHLFLTYSITFLI